MFIILGVTGGIAAYKAVYIARALVEGGHDVHVIPTADALRFVGLPTWEAISRNPVTTSVHEDVAKVRHVALGQQADLIIVAPATANTIAKMTAGLADDLLGTTLLATRAPVAIAPAMHTEMWQHPSTQANIRTLQERGVTIIGPESGRLTGADTGPGRMTEPDAIVAAALALTQPGDLDGVAVVVSAGGTREPIDPVRFIGNRSSGKQGVAVAVAAARRGAAVTLVAANVEAEVLAAAKNHPHITIVGVGATAELDSAMQAASQNARVVIMAAAVADYRPQQVSDNKLRKEDGDGSMRIDLVENPDILAGLAKNRTGEQVIVGFAAETVASKEELIERGTKKRQRKGVDLLAVNAVGWSEGFESDDNTVTFIDSDDAVVDTVTGSKGDTASALVDQILALLNRPAPSPSA